MVLSSCGTGTGARSGGTPSLAVSKIQMRVLRGRRRWRQKLYFKLRAKLDFLKNTFYINALLRMLKSFAGLISHQKTATRSFLE
jgi:hypothetical protein